MNNGILQNKPKAIMINTSKYKNNIVNVSSELASLKKSLLIFSNSINSYCNDLSSTLSGMTKGIAEMSNILSEMHQLQFHAFNDRLKDILGSLRRMSEPYTDFKFQFPNFESFEKSDQIEVEVDVDEIESVIGKEAVQNITNITNNYYINYNGEKKVKLSAEDVIKLIIALWGIISFIWNKCEENSNIQQEQNVSQQTEYHEVFKLYNSVVEQLPDYYELSLEE